MNSVLLGTTNAKFSWGLNTPTICVTFLFIILVITPSAGVSIKKSPYKITIAFLIAYYDNLDNAIVAYNAGEGNVSLWLMDEQLSSDGKTLKSIPFAESREYLNKIHKNFEKYKIDKEEVFGKEACDPNEGN